MQKKKIIDVRGMVLCALFATLIAVGAFIKIPIPYVPITLQFLFTNLAGLLLGKRKGLIAVCLYIFIGLAGVPVFTQGGGPAYIFQPTFGYIIGFALGTWFAGLIAEHGTNSIKTYIIAGLLNFVAMFAIGLIHLYLILNFYLSTPTGIVKILSIGFLPFALGDVVLIIVCAILAKRLRPFIEKGKTTA
ncbi:MAG: biotin transporter BioY [Firmicutes bacterium HGW-Firmicutes-16]|nr:MAG: biotin transporter BioY [Firmicutes bacterium HGW-Firmicutes-16]